MNARRFQMGLGRVGENLQRDLYAIPKEISQDLDPETIKALRRQATLQLGLGMLAAKERGMGLGGGVNQALQESQRGLTGGLGQAYVAKRSQREDERLRLLDERATRRENLYDEQFKLSRSDRLADNARQDAAQRYQRERDVRLDSDRAVDNARQQALADVQIDLSKRTIAKEKYIERLGMHLARLRQFGKKDDDKVVASVLSRLDSLGVNAYQPVPRYDPFAGMFGGGLGAPGGQQMPPLDGLYNPAP